MSSIPKPVVPAQISWDELSAIVSEGEVRPAVAEDAVEGVAPQRVIEPANEQELAKALAWANANGVTVAARGGGTKMSWGAAPAALDAVISTKKLGRVLEHAWADMTATVEAGCTVAALQSKLAEHGQRLAIDPLFPERATIGGLIATNDGGSLRLRYGGVRDLIIGITVALPDGTLAKSGGKVVKNVAGYDLQKLMTGALGTLGVITQATFRLHPLAKETRTITVETADVAAANRVMLAVMDSVIVPTGIQVRVGTQDGAQPRPHTTKLDIRLEGTGAGIEAQRKRLEQIVLASELKESADEVWRACGELFEARGQTLICKVSVLPSQLAQTAEAVARLSSSRDMKWGMVAQATGLGVVRVDAAENSQLQFAVNGIRAAVEKLGGTVVVLECPAEVKKQVDVWGKPRDAQPLMVRIKQRFDPKGILNRGRFVGGI